MNGVWISWVRFNGGDLLEAGATCRLDIEQIVPQVILLSDVGPKKPTGLRARLTDAAFVPVDGHFECWGPNNPGGITDPVSPWGYVSLLLMEWVGLGLSGHPAHAGVGTFTGTQTADDVRAAITEAKEAGTIPPYNGWAAVPTLDAPQPQAPPEPGDETT